MQLIGLELVKLRFGKGKIMNEFPIEADMQERYPFWFSDPLLSSMDPCFIGWSGYDRMDYPDEVRICVYVPSK